MLLIGIVLASGVHRLPSWEDYWSRNPILGTPGIIMGMPILRFKVLMKYPHLNDNTAMPARGQPGYDKLFKLRPLLEEINKNSLAMYDPHREVSINEAMVLFKGRSLFKQYMPQKLIKRGFKLWLRCDPHKGFMSQCEVYSGKDPNGSVETQLGAKVVKSLSKMREKDTFFFLTISFRACHLLKNCWTRAFTALLPQDQTEEIGQENSKTWRG